MSVWSSLVFCTITNVAITAMFLKYSSHPTPLIAIGQLMVPLLVWEALLVLSFCPDEVIDEWLMLNYIDDEAERFLRRHRRPLHTVHSAGDVIQDQDFMLTDEGSLRVDDESFRFQDIDDGPRLVVD